MSSTINLDAIFTPGDEVLKVQYTVTNLMPEPVWLLDRLWQYTPTGDLEDDAVGAYLSLGVDGVLSVGRIIHPLPQQMLVEQHLIPFARRLDAAQSVSDTLYLSLPIREVNPYYDDPKPEDQLSKETTAARFLLAWVPQLPGMTVADAPLAGGKILDAPSFLPEVRTERTAKVGLTVSAKRRTDSFERFA